MNHKHPLAALSLCAALASMAPADAFAQDAGVSADVTADAAVAAAPSTPHPVGVADRPSEAPGGTGLAALPGESVPPHAQVTAQGMSNDPAASRSMAFSAGGGECRDTIPGGPILAAAYAVILLLLGAYAFMIGRKNAALGAQIDELEKILAKRAEEKGA
jgi:hypothetical protein